MIEFSVKAIVEKYKDNPSMIVRDLNVVEQKIAMRAMKEYAIFKFLPNQSDGEKLHRMLQYEVRHLT